MSYVYIKSLGEPFGISEQLDAARQSGADWEAVAEELGAEARGLREALRRWER